MSVDSNHSILNEYDAQRHTYEQFCTKLESLLIELLSGSEVAVHSVTSRVKTRLSLDGKLTRSDDKYQTVQDITDIVGVRVITYFTDDVEKVSDIITREFEIDKDNSIDKRTILDPDRFGYVSTHFVVSLQSDRTKLFEYKNFDGLKAEIQVRSILQHTWAEIEHDLGYKSSVEVPKHIRRDFARLAGLLELADKEFLSIRHELDHYIEKLDKGLDKKLDHTTYDVSLDLNSLTTFVAKNPIVIDLDREICRLGKSDNGKSPPNANWLGRQLRRLNFVEINTVGQLESLLSQNKDEILQFASSYLNGSKQNNFGKGISLFYLCYVLLARLGNEDRIVEYLKEGHIGGSNARYSLITNKIMSTYKAITSIKS